MWALERPNGQGHVVQLPAATVIDPARGHALHDDVERLAVDVGRLLGADAEKADLVRRGAAPHAEFETAAAQLIEHADLFREANGIVDRQQVDERAEAYALRPLRDGGEPDARGGRKAERRAVVLAHLIDVEAASVAELDQLQTVFVLLVRREAAGVILIEKAEFHGAGLR